MAPVAGSLSLDDLDIVTPAVYQQAVPFAAFETLRREAPVYWYHRPGFEPFWAITKYDDIAWIERNPQLFSSGSRLSLADIDHLDHRLAKKERRAAETGCPFDKPADLLYMDPPEHRQHRSIFARSFSPRLVGKSEDLIRDLAQQYAAEFLADLQAADGEPVNAVESLSGKLPITAISVMIGVSGRSWADVERWVNAMFSHRVADSAVEKSVREVEQAYRAFVLDMAQQRRANPRDDLVTKLVQAEIGGLPLTDREILDHITLLFGAGYETTRSASTMGLNALLRHPAELRKLAADPGLVDTAVEEILRWTTPVIQFSRVCLEDTEIRGQRVRKGETVVMFFVSGNRDEDVFAAPHQFDITRSPNPHMAFGGGEHFCLGVNLARIELRALFAELRPVLSRLELAGQPEMLPNSILTHAVESLPVRLRAESAA
jgi:cytochrome P450